MIEGRNSPPYVVFASHVSLSILFLSFYASLKLFAFTLPGTVQFFQSMGLPGWFAYVVMFAGVAGGVALVAGFYARYVALALFLLILGTIFTVLGANGWLFSNQSGGWEYPVFWAVSLAVLILLGDGKAAFRPAGGLSRS